MSAVRDRVEPSLGSPSRPGAPRTELLGLAVVLALGLAARVVLFRSSVWFLNPDEATTGIQAIELWRGRVWTFVPGNVYGGNGDVWLAAPFEALFSASVLRLKVLAALTWVAASGLVYVAVRRRTGPGPAILAATAIWVPSAALVHLSIEAYPGYASGLLATAGVMFVVAELDDRAPRMLEALVLGALAGFAVWQHPLYVYTAAPFVAWVSWRNRRSLTTIASIGAGGLVSLAAPIAYNLRHDLASVSQDRADPPLSYTTRVRDWIGDLVPRAAGAKWLNDDWVLGVLGRPALAVALLVVAALCVLVIMKGRGHARVAAATALAAPLAVPLFDGAWFTSDARYAIVVLVPLAVALAHGAHLVRERLAPGIAAVIAVGWAVLAVAVPFGVVLDEVTGDLSTASVAAVLEEHGITRVRADYWLAYQLTYETDESIVASPISAIRFGHYESLVREAEAEGTAALVLFNHQVPPFLAGGPGFEGQQAYRASPPIAAGRYTVFLPPDTGASP